MTDNIKAGSPAESFKAASLKVTQKGGNVDVCIAFSAMNDFSKVRNVLQEEKGWLVGKSAEITDTRFNLNATVYSSTVLTVADRLRQIGITTVPAMPAPAKP